MNSYNIFITDIFSIVKKRNRKAPVSFTTDYYVSATQIRKRNLFGHSLKERVRKPVLIASDLERE